MNLNDNKISHARFCSFNFSHAQDHEHVNESKKIFLSNEDFIKNQKIIYTIIPEDPNNLATFDPYPKTS